MPFSVAPTTSTHIIEPGHFVAGLRFYLLLPQLLRRSDCAPIRLDEPRRANITTSHMRPIPAAAAVLIAATVIYDTLTPVPYRNQKLG